MMVKQNSSVKLSGKREHNIALDEYVETYVVKTSENVCIILQFFLFIESVSPFFCL